MIEEKKEAELRTLTEDTLKGFQMDPNFVLADMSLELANMLALDVNEGRLDFKTLERCFSSTATPGNDPEPSTYPSLLVSSKDKEEVSEPLTTFDQEKPSTSSRQERRREHHQRRKQKKADKIAGRVTITPDTANVANAETLKEDPVSGDTEASGVVVNDVSPSLSLQDSNSRDLGDSTTSTTLKELKNSEYMIDGHAATMAKLRVEDPPLSVEETDEQSRESEREGQRLRSDSIKFIRERTLSKDAARNARSLQASDESKVENRACTPPSSSPERPHSEPRSRPTSGISVASPSDLTQPPTSPAPATTSLPVSYTNRPASRSAPTDKRPAPSSAPMDSKTGEEKARLFRENAARRVAIPYQLMQRRPSTRSLEPIAEENTATVEDQERDVTAAKKDNSMSENIANESSALNEKASTSDENRRHKEAMARILQNAVARKAAADEMNKPRVTHTMASEDFKGEETVAGPSKVKKSDILSVPHIEPPSEMQNLPGDADIAKVEMEIAKEAVVLQKEAFTPEERRSRARIIHRRCNSIDVLPTALTHSPFSLSTSLPANIDHGEDLSNDESDDGAAPTRPTREPHTYTPWANNLPWAYFDPTKPFEPQLRPDIAFFARPEPMVPTSALLNPRTISPAHADMAPYVLSTWSPRRHVYWSYDAEHHRLLIRPHRQAYVECRQQLTHPDYLVRAKLCQYQAVERSGFKVWRHDRNTLTCKLPTCHTAVVDHDISTQICHGCGPKTTVRYCSRKHLLQDLKEHWKECGDASLVLRYWVDEATQPGRFYRRYPTIDDINCKRSFQKLRQRAHAIYAKGQYTLFLLGTTPHVVRWPAETIGAEQAEMMQARVERVLNMCFFDQNQDSVVEYLYRLIRMALRATGDWTADTARCLSMQLRLEFEWDSRVVNASPAFDEDPCGCYWFGDEWNHFGRRPSEGCKHLQEHVGIVRHGQCMKSWVEKSEACYWPLRIWRRRHETELGWRARLYGKGFGDNVPAYQRDELGMVPILGKGWHGWGSVAKAEGDPGSWRKVD